MSAARAAAISLSLVACRDPASPPPPTSTSLPPSASPSAAPSPARSLRAMLRPAARRALDECTVSLLVPNDPTLLTAADVRASASWAAITFMRGDHTLTLHAARRAAPPPTRRGVAEDVPRLDRVRGRPASVVVRDGHRVATWEERGVTYTIDLACVAVDDPRCARERHLHELASALVPLDDAAAVAR